MPNHARQLRTAIAPGLLFGALGFAVNWLDLTLFFGVSIFLGSFFVMVALLRHGTGAAVLAALIAGSYTLISLHHPWALLVTVGEAVFVGLMLRRTRSLVLLDTIYWFCIGIPLTLLYRVLLQTDLPLAFLLALKQGVNGIFNALAAALMLLLASLAPSLKRPGQISPGFHQLLATSMVATILIPGICHVVVEIRRDIDLKEQQVRQQLHSTIGLTRRTIETWLADKTNDVETLAGVVGDPQTVPADYIQKEAERMKLLSPHFDRMSVQNGKAVSVAFVPAVDKQGRSNVGRDYSSMPYHRILRKTLRPTVSDVDYGTVTSRPRLALFAPIVIDGEFRGYCTGVLEISRLAEQLRIISGNRAVDITLLDRKRQVIVSTDPALAMMERLEQGRGREFRHLGEGFYQLIPRAGGDGDLNRWQRASFGMDSLLNPDVPWSIVVSAPMKPFLAELEQNAGRGFALLLVLILFSVATAQAAGAAFTRPIARLEQISASLPPDLIQHQQVQWPRSGIREVAGLITNVRLMTTALHNYVRELHALNESLERRVDERTEELHRSEQKFRAIFMEAGVGILLADRNRRIMDCNPATEMIFGYSRRELIGKAIADISHPEDEAPSVELCRQTAERGENVYRMEKRYIRKDGSILWGKLIVSFIRAVDGSVAFLLGMVEDITQQRELQTALGESEAMHRSLVETAPYAITVTTLDGAILMANRQALSIYGENRIAEIIGRPLLDWVAPAEKDSALELFTRVVAGEVLRSVLIRLRKLDGSEFIGEVSATRLPAVAGATDRIIIISADVTAREEAADEIRRLNEVLEARVAERTAELEAALRHMESFSYTISHDLRAPLRAVDGYVHLVQEDFGGALPPPLPDYLARISGNVRRMGMLIDDLLTYSRLNRQQLDKTRLDPATVVEQVLDELRHELAGRRVSITVDPLPPCMADPMLLRHVYLNLIGNAIKYSRGTDPTLISIGARLGDGEMVYHVADDGVGFDMAYSHKLFGVFERLHSPDRFEGTGVGLAIVQNVIHRHGGRVWAEAQEGKGATFYFTLPEGSPAPEKPAVPPPPAP